MKKRQFTGEYKAKLILEVLSEEQSISEIASRENLSRTQLQNWKREFIENSARVFAQNKLEKDAARQMRESQEREGDLMKKVGQLTIEVDWLKKSLRKYWESIGKRSLVSKDDALPVNRQCALLGLNRSSVYYTPQEASTEQKEHEEHIKARLDFWHTHQCCLGVRGLRTKLRKEDKLRVGRKLIRRYIDEIGIYGRCPANCVNGIISIRKKERKAMSQRNKNEQALIETISQDCKTPAEASAKLKEMFGGLLEKMLEAELDEHLGYEKHSVQGDGSGNSRNGHGRKTVKTEWGEAEIGVPRDRNSIFEPQAVEKRQTRTDDIENRILAMYAKGMSTRDIEDHLRDIYGVEASSSLISRITDKVMPLVTEWQNRPLDGVYPIVFLDGIVFKVRRDAKVVNKCLYSVLGINMDGRKEILGCGCRRTNRRVFGQVFVMNPRTEVSVIYSLRAVITSVASRKR